MAGASPRALELMAELCDGWIPAWHTPELYKQRIGEIYSAAKENGRGNKKFTIANEIVACVAKKPEEARRISAKTVETLTAGFVVTSSEKAIESSLIGSTDEVFKKVETLVDSGVNHFEMKFIYSNMNNCVDQLRLFSNEVMPSFR